MMRRLARRAAMVAVMIAAACSESKEPGSEPGAADGGNPDGGSPNDASSGPDAPQDVAAQDSPSDSGQDAGPDGGGPFTLTSSAFVNGGNIPAIHTCNGTNASPPLAWSGAPAGTQSYAVVMRDLSLGGSNYHWVIYDIPAATTSLPQGVPAGPNPATPAGAKQTNSSFGGAGQFGHFGPCPPAEHTYEYTVYSFPTPTIPVASSDPAAADGVVQAEKTGSASVQGKYQQ